MVSAGASATRTTYMYRITFGASRHFSRYITAMSRLQDAAIQLAETIQTAPINHHPSRRDMAPSTAADKKETVQFRRAANTEEFADDVDEDEVPLSALRPLPREEKHAPKHMQLPDLRFEQSYLKSIEQAKDWKMVTYITMKDQILMPLVQGVAWTLIVSWWRHWNTATKFSGQTVGARIRRWWWEVNSWSVPDYARNTSSSGT